jgi:hypothetical protein
MPGASNYIHLRISIGRHIVLLTRIVTKTKPGIRLVSDDMIFIIAEIACTE